MHEESQAITTEQAEIDYPADKISSDST